MSFEGGLEFGTGSVEPRSCSGSSEPEHFRDFTWLEAFPCMQSQHLTFLLCQRGERGFDFRREIFGLGSSLLIVLHELAQLRGDRVDEVVSTARGTVSICDRMSSGRVQPPTSRVAGGDRVKPSPSDRESFCQCIGSIFCGIRSSESESKHCFVMQLKQLLKSLGVAGSAVQFSEFWCH